MCCRLAIRRAPMLYGMPREKLLLLSDAETSEQKSIFVSFVTEVKHTEPSPDVPNLSQDNLAIHHALNEVDCVANDHGENMLIVPEVPKEVDVVSNGHERKVPVPEVSMDADTVSNCQERKMPVVKIKVKQSTATSRAEADNRTVERSQGGNRASDRGASSSVSVDAPQRNSAEAVSFSNQNVEEVTSCHDQGSRMTASIGSVKLPSKGDNFGKELQCTADSSKVSIHLHPDDPSSPSIMQDNNVDTGAKKSSLQTLSGAGHGLNGGSVSTVVSPFQGKEKEKKKDKEKKRNETGKIRVPGEETSEEREKTKGERRVGKCTFSRVAC